MIRHFSWVYKRSMFVKLYVTMMYQCVYGNLISIMLRIVYLAEPPYGTLCLLVQITNRRYIRNHFISNVLKPSNFLPRRQ